MEGYHVGDFIHRDGHEYILWVSNDHYYKVPRPISKDCVIMDFDNELPLETWVSLYE